MLRQCLNIFQIALRPHVGWEQRFAYLSQGKTRRQSPDNRASRFLEVQPGQFLFLEVLEHVFAVALEMSEMGQSLNLK